MKIGDCVHVPVLGGRTAMAHVIDIKGDYIIVAGDEERRRAAAENRKPIGVGFKGHLVKDKKLANTD